MIFYCNERVYITEVYIDTILFLFWKDNHLYICIPQDITQLMN